MAVAVTSRLSRRLRRGLFLVPELARKRTHVGVSASQQLRIVLGTCAGASLCFRLSADGTRVRAECSEAANLDVADDRLHVVLDIDETLVRSQVIDTRSMQCYSQKTSGFVMQLPCGVAMWVVKRPGMDNFICWLKDKGFGVSLYSAGTRLYVDELRPWIDPEGFIEECLCRDDCVQVPELPNVYLKDLRLVRSGAFGPDGVAMRANLARTVLVDNNPVSFKLQPENGILVSDWLGFAVDDDEFERVKSLLLELECASRGSDVRLILPKLLQLEREGVRQSARLERLQYVFVDFISNERPRSTL